MKTATYFRRYLACYRPIAWLLFTVFGPLKIRGRNRVPVAGGLLVLSNHLADVDPLALQAASPRPIRFMAKSDLFDMKIVGPIIKSMGAFPVKRGEADRAAIKQAVELIKEGYAVGIFPEGQLSEDGKLQELKSGVALVARLTGCPVVCCGIQRTNRILPYGKLLPRPSFSRVAIHWGEPRSFGKDVSADEFMAWVESELRSLTNQ